MVQRSHDLEGMGEIRVSIGHPTLSSTPGHLFLSFILAIYSLRTQDKMKNLCIPFRIKALSELRDPAHSHSPLQYSVMVIDEVI